MKVTRLRCWLLCAAVLQAVTSGAQPVTKVATGSGHSLFLQSNGSVWGMGFHRYGQLGVRICDSIKPREGFVASEVVAIPAAGNSSIRPEQIVASGVTAIAAGNLHSLLLTSDGSLWAMGHNASGQLGDGTFHDSCQPEQIIATGVTAIAAGYWHSLFLKKDGSLWGMGGNSDGQLGDGTCIDGNKPVQIAVGGVTAIAAGFTHSLFVKRDGSLWGMGDNRHGELGDGTYHQANRPEQIVASGVMAIAAGGAHSLFLKSDGSLWAMGGNICGQLGDGTGHGINRPERIVANGVTAIAAGNFHSLFLKSDGSLWATGFRWGGSGLGTPGTRSYDETSRPRQIVASGVTAMATEGDHCLFVKNDGSLWGMGENDYGQLGDGTYSYADHPEPIVAAPSGDHQNLVQRSVDGTTDSTHRQGQPLPAAPPYNHISMQLIGDGSVRLTFMGMARTNYALDRSFSLSPATWVPQATNSADVSGMVLFNYAPNPNTNNFWRVRSVP